MIRKKLKFILYKLCFISPLFRRYLVEWQLIGTSFNILVVNFIFQRIFRFNSKMLFSVNYASKIAAAENIKLNMDKSTVRSFALSGNCYFQALNGINIGANFLFAPGVKIISANHSKEIIDLHEKSKPIVIGSNVWLGANVIILPEVEIGDNCIVGAGSVVTKSFKDTNLIIAGNPAKIIKKY